MFSKIINFINFIFERIKMFFSSSPTAATSSSAPIVWSTLQNMVADGSDSSAVKQTAGSGWGSAWCFSNQTFAASGGSVSYTVVMGSGSDAVQGLINNTTTPISYTNLTYGFQNEAGGISIYETGTNRGIFGGSLATGDVVTLAWTAGGTITYAKNGTVVYTSGVSPSGMTLRPCIASDAVSTDIISASTVTT